MKLAVLVLHTSPATADVDAYLADYAYTTPFAVDEGGSLGALLGASAVLPQTIVLDPTGVVTYNRTGSLSCEELCAMTGRVGGWGAPCHSLEKNAPKQGCEKAENREAGNGIAQTAIPFPASLFSSCRVPDGVRFSQAGRAGK